MKKQQFPILLSITLLFAGFLLGFLVGRNHGRDPVLVSVSDSVLIPPTEAAAAETEPSFPIDLNRADKTALMSLPGIGEKLALRILTYRRERGAFQDLQTLYEIEGIDRSVIDQISDLVTIGG